MERRSIVSEHVERLSVLFEDGTRVLVSLAEVQRALAATSEEHARARDAIACPVCGSSALAECVFGAIGRPAGTPERSSGTVHTHRMRAFLGWLGASRSRRGEQPRRSPDRLGAFSASLAQG